MIGTIRKHSKALWLIIIVVIIVTFVFWDSISRRAFDSAQEASYGSISGQKVTRDDFEAAKREVILRYYLMRNEWPTGDFDLQQETYLQLFLIQKQKDLGIHTDPDAIATFVANRIRMASQGGNVVSLDMFAKQVLARGGVTAADFERCARHELGRIQLIEMASLSGNFISNDEIRSLYVRANQEYSTQAAVFLATNYFGSVTQSVAAINEFYTNSLANYRLPERIRVTYVKFPASNFLAEAVAEINQRTNLAEILEVNYQIQKTNIANAPKSADEVKSNILHRAQNEIALGKAHTNALAFASRLFQITPARPEMLELFARSNGLTAEISQPFDSENGPKELEVRENFATVAFNLSADEPYAGPLPEENAVYIIAPKDKLPSEIPSFESVREKVVEDYKFNQAIRLAHKAGEDFSATLTNSLAAGKSFMAACTEARVKTVLPPAFSLRTEKLPEVETFVNMNGFKQVTLATEPGRPSRFYPTRDGGFIVFVAAKLPLDETKMRSELPNFASAVRQNRESEAFNFWLQKEAGQALKDVPALQRQQPPPPGTGPGQ